METSHIEAMPSHNLITKQRRRNMPGVGGGTSESSLVGEPLTPIKEVNVSSIPLSVGWALPWKEMAKRDLFWMLFTSVSLIAMRGSPMRAFQTSPPPFPQGIDRPAMPETSGRPAICGMALGGPAASCASPSSAPLSSALSAALRCLRAACVACASRLATWACPHHSQACGIPYLRGYQMWVM